MELTENERMQIMLGSDFLREQYANGNIKILADFFGRKYVSILWSETGGLIAPETYKKGKQFRDKIVAALKKEGYVYHRGDYYRL